MKHITKVRELYEETIHWISESEDSWKNFLSCMGRLYQLDFLNTCMVYASVQTTQIYTESPQATVDKHIREWNEMNFPRSIYIDEKDLEERNVPDFLKSH